jgi:methyltransferase (TIGR00027 family)
MRPGHESTTAVMVCMARAFAHGASSVSRFSDPTAFELLPAEARKRVEQAKQGVVPRQLAARLRHVSLQKRSVMMALRTVAIDDAVRGAACQQLVILGAGLDGRAWRMSELKDVTVFEVDHPDSQREKRERAAKLTPLAGSIHFVPVDFTHDKLADALEAAGHDAKRPTVWVWEGVVMYLSPEQVEDTLEVIDRRSAGGSRLIIAYHAPALMLHLVGWLVRRVGEPLRSTYSPQAMRSLLHRYRFDIEFDEDFPSLGARLAPQVARDLRVMKHGRIVVADRPGA